MGNDSFGQEKANKHKHFRWDGVRDKQEPSLGQMGPLPGTKWDPSLGQTGLFLLNSTVKSPFCPVCPWDGWGFIPGTIVPQGPSEKCLCVLCLLFFCSQFILAYIKTFWPIIFHSVLDLHLPSPKKPLTRVSKQVPGVHGKTGLNSGRKKAQKHKLFALVNLQMALGQTAGCPRVNRAKKFMCSPRNTGNINFFPLVNRRVVPGLSRLLNKKTHVFKVYVPFSCPWRGVGRKGWRRVGKGLADLLAPPILQFSRRPCRRLGL